MLIKDAGSEGKASGGGLFSIIKKAAANPQTSVPKIVNSSLLSGAALAVSTKKPKESQNAGNGGGNAAAASGNAVAAEKTRTFKASGKDIVTWSGGGGVSFFVKPKKIQAVKDITIKASANTEEKESDGEKITRLKTVGAYTVTMTGMFNALLGVNVQKEAMKITEAARKGETGYLYSAGSKLFSPQFMMTDAEATDILMTGRGEWISCNVKMTLKQCSKGDGNATPMKSGSGGGSGKKLISGAALNVKKVVEDGKGGGVKKLGEGTAADKLKAQQAAAAVEQTNSAKEQSKNMTTPGDVLKKIFGL